MKPARKSTLASGKQSDLTMHRVLSTRVIMKMQGVCNTFLLVLYLAKDFLYRATAKAVSTNDLVLDSYNDKIFKPWKPKGFFNLKSSLMC